MKDLAIKVDNLSKTFWISEKKRTSFVEYLTDLIKDRNLSVERFDVLKNVNLEVKRGDIVGILGRNGTGKSTLMKLIAGIYPPTSGTVTTKGRLVPLLELGVGFNPELSGRDNIYLNGTILGMREAYIKEKFDEIIAFAEVEKFVDTPLKNFSSGMQVRLGFAIAMMAEADIYLLDEVFAVGDVQFQQKCRNFFLEKKNDGITVLLVTHSADLIRTFCNKAAVIEDGELITGLTLDQAIAEYIDG